MATILTFQTHPCLACCLFICETTTSLRSMETRLRWPTSKRSALRVELPHPTTRMSSFVLQYLIRTDESVRFNGTQVADLNPPV